MKTLVLGSSIQGLIAGALLARVGGTVTLVDFEENPYDDFAKGYKTGPVTHVPFALSYDVVDQLDLESHELDVASLKGENPFKQLPFYESLKTLLNAFQSLDNTKPAYNEKAWRDAWGTFELGRVLANCDAATQKLFAHSTTLSLVDLMVASGLGDAVQAQLIALCVCGSKTDPNAKGSAASILPAMAVYEGEHYVIQGGLDILTKSLKQSAMSYGVSFHEGQVVQSVTCENGAVHSVTMDGGEILTADHYVVDHDPVIVFEKYMKAATLPPAFRNRVTAAQNLRESAQIQLALSEVPAELQNNHNVAPSVEYITNARSDLKKDGGSQLAMLSIVNVTDDNSDFCPEGQCAIDILAHYFDPALATDAGARDLQILAVIQALDQAYPGISDKIIHSQFRAINSQGGQANFMGAMPLLQLFKIFFGHHAIGYDVPYNNLLIAGYGAGACAHYHVNKGGMRVATLLQSLNNDGKS